MTQEDIQTQLFQIYESHVEQLNQSLLDENLTVFKQYLPLVLDYLEDNPDNMFTNPKKLPQIELLFEENDGLGKEKISILKTLSEQLFPIASEVYKEKIFLNYLQYVFKLDSEYIARNKDTILDITQDLFSQIEFDRQAGRMQVYKAIRGQDTLEYELYQMLSSKNFKDDIEYYKKVLFHIVMTDEDNDVESLLDYIANLSLENTQKALNVMTIGSCSLLEIAIYEVSDEIYLKLVNLGAKFKDEELADLQRLNDDESTQRVNLYQKIQIEKEKHLLEHIIDSEQESKTSSKLKL